MADYVYFPQSQRRLMSELYTILPDILRMMPSMLKEYFYLVILALVGAAAFIYLSLRLFKKLLQSIPYRFNIFSEVSEGLSFILLCVLMIVGIRGGWQSRPIRQAHGFFSTHRIIGYLTLNSSFTVLRSITQQSLPTYNALPKAEARLLIDEMLRAKNEQLIDPDYPFLRKTSFPNGSKKYNVVIFIMESWTGDYCGAITGQTSSLPFLDSIAGQGMFFTNFLANGQRSVIAETSILTSIPGLFSATMEGKKKVTIGSRSELNRYLGLGTILMKEGYYTSFHHGARTGSMGFDAFTKMAGFPHYFGKEDYPGRDSRTDDGTWGIWDEEFFLDFNRRINSSPQPFCSVLFSLTSHDPFNIPPQREDLFKQYEDETKFSRVLRYSDYSLQQFFKAAKEEPWFNNTIFIICGDHTNYCKKRTLHSFYNIPLLIYAPAIIKPERRDYVGSQVDILPTILDLLQISTVHAATGRSLLDSARTHYAVISEGAYPVIFDNKYVLLDDMERTLGLYDYHLDPHLTNDLQAKEPEIAGDMRRKLYAYVQEVSNAVKNDRVCREQDIIIPK